VPASNGDGNMLKAILAYVDKPWKAFAVALLAIVGVATFIVYQQRAQIAQAILRGHVAPQLLVDQYKEDAVSLLTSTRGDVTQLLSADLVSNVAQYVAGFDRNGQSWQISPLPRSIIDEGVSVADVVKLIEGTPFCLDVSVDDRLPQHRAFAEAGILRGCIVGVPPVLGVLVGALFVGWKQPLPEHDEYGALQLMRSEAMKLATW
jgi:hypothetical protein